MACSLGFDCACEFLSQCAKESDPGYMLSACVCRKLGLLCGRHNTRDLDDISDQALIEAIHKHIRSVDTESIPADDWTRWACSRGVTWACSWPWKRDVQELENKVLAQRHRGAQVRLEYLHLMLKMPVHIRNPTSSTSTIYVISEMERDQGLIPSRRQLNLAKRL